MKRDVAIKKDSLLQELHCFDTEVFVKLVDIYCSSLYGSKLWDLFSEDVERIYRSILLRQSPSVDHLKTMLTSCFVRFTESLTLSCEAAVSYLAKVTMNDNRNLMGRTLSHVQRKK